MNGLIPSAFRPAEVLEAHLGDPLSAERPLSFTAAVARDQDGAYPTEALALLDRWGLSLHYVPTALGGGLSDYATAHALLRVVARRDLTTALAHGKTYLGASPVWVAGSAEQKARVAQLVLAARRVSLGLTEETHGSDLAANEVAAEPRGGAGWSLRGAKWAISNATRGHAITVLARTDAEPGPRGLSLFFVDKAALPEGAVSYTPRLRTHGVRGADISGIRFHEAALGPESLVGPRGAGLEIALKALQISRALVGAFSLGAADTALRATLAFARERRLYGEPVNAIPHARHVLTTCFVDLLTADAVSLAACRLLHHRPGSLPTVSAVAKYFVPSTLDDLIRRLAVVLGARYYLCEGHWAGIFEKMMRDAALIGLFDGSTVVNLAALGAQMRLWATRRERDSRPVLDSAFDLEQAAPPFDPGRLELVHRGPHDVIESIETAAVVTGPLDGAARSVLEAAVPVLVDEREALARDVGRALADSTGPAFARSPRLFALARRYCLLHAAGCALLVWRANRGAATRFAAAGEWPALAVASLLSSLGRSLAVPESLEERVWAQLCALDAEARLFSLVPLRVAPVPAARIA